MRPRRLMVALSAACLAACAHMATAADEPARLVEPDEAVRAELVLALTEALGAAPRGIAADALVAASELVIERAALSGRANPALTGRTLEAGVQRFVLVRNRGRCELVRPADGWRRVIESARCVPAN